MVEVLGGLVGEGGGGLRVRGEVALGVFAAQGAELGELGIWTPSAVQVSPSAWARSMTAVTMALSSGSRPSPWMKVWSIWRVMEAFEVAEGRVAGAEVVDGEVDALGLQRPEGAGRGGGVVHEGGLGDLKLERAGLEAAALEDAVDLVGEGGFVELAGRKG